MTKNAKLERLTDCEGNKFWAYELPPQKAAPYEQQGLSRAQALLAEQGQDFEPCYLCLREIKITSRTKYVEVVWGGGYAVSQRKKNPETGKPYKDEYNEDDDRGYLGCHPVGSHCAKNIPADAMLTFPEESCPT
jgi:hypothetical protein